MNFTICNDVLFKKVMGKEEICRPFLEVLLDISIDEISVIHTEHEILGEIGGKSIRLDVFVRDCKGRTYDIEMQRTGKNEDLPNRSRVYQAGIDRQMLLRGHKYDEIPNAYLIFICEKDPFGQNESLYDFAMINRRNKNQELGDGSRRIFINVEKENPTDVPQLIADFMKYVGYNRITGNYIEAINKELEIVTGDRKVREAAMDWELEKQYSLQKGREEGYSQGRKEGYSQGRKEGFSQGRRESRNHMLLAMLANGASAREIARLTNVSMEEIEALRQQ